MLKKKNEIEVKHGALPDPNQAISMKAEQHELRSGIPVDIRTTIERDWNVGLLYTSHPDYIRKIFIVKMISKATNDYVFIPAPILRNKKKVPLIVEELDGLGVFQPEQMEDLCEYVDYLKRDAKSSVLTWDEDYEFDIRGVSKDSIEDEAAKYYNLIKECIKFNPEFFPDESEHNFDNESHMGARLTTGKYVNYTHAIKPSFLQDFWDVNTLQQKAIKTVWVKQGLMHRGWGSQSRRSFHVTLNKEAKKMYVMKFDMDEESKGHE